LKNKLASILVSSTVTACLKAILQACSTLDLVPLRIWGWQDGSSQGVTYISCISSAAIAAQLPFRTNRVRWIATAIGVIILISTWIAYSSLTNYFPTPEMLWITGFPAQFLLFMTYISFGWTVALVIGFYFRPPSRTLPAKKNARGGAQEERPGKSEVRRK
jgi:hypothetical protein